MGETIAGSCDASYTDQWINDSFTIPSPREALSTDIDEDGFATRFHKTCIRVLKLVTESIPGGALFGKNDARAASMKEELGRLYLWGESFESQDLDEALDQSDEVRDNVLELFCDIGESLINGNIDIPFVIEILRESECHASVYRYIYRYIEVSHYGVRTLCQECDGDERAVMFALRSATAPHSDMSNYISKYGSENWSSIFSILKT